MSALITRRGGIAGAADLAKELVDLGWKNAVFPKAVQKLVLAFLHPIENPDIGRHDLCQDLGQLPQFQEAGIGIVRKIPLREHPKPQKLLIMRLQMREIAAQARTELHGIRRFERWWNVTSAPDGGGQIWIGRETRMIRAHANKPNWDGKDEPRLLAKMKPPAFDALPRMVARLRRLGLEGMGDAAGESTPRLG